MCYNMHKAISTVKYGCHKGLYKLIISPVAAGRLFFCPNIALTIASIKETSDIDSYVFNSLFLTFYIFFNYVNPKIINFADFELLFMLKNQHCVT
jgi:hypothetical protein